MSIQRVCFFWNEQLSCCHFHFLDVHRFIYLFGNISIQAGLGGRALVLLLEKFLTHPNLGFFPPWNFSSPTLKPNPSRSTAGGDDLAPFFTQEKMRCEFSPLQPHVQ